jgi:hypothetical protein
MPVLIPVRKLQKFCDPFNSQPWGVRVKRKDVRLALSERRMESKPGTDDHAARIAWLVKNPAKDAIEIDVGCPALGCHSDWMVADGNHRLAAAIYAKQPMISANIDGQIDYAESIFGVSLQETSPDTKEITTPPTPLHDAHQGGYFLFND